MATKSSKSPAKKSLAKTSPKTSASKKASANTSAAKKTVAGKAAAKKAPAKTTAAKKSGGRKYSPAASKQVQREMHEMHEGKLTIGKSGKKVTNPKQAIAIGLSEARRAGKKVPPNPNDPSKK